ncbi:MAG: prepilin-type N-terminal cleavage/methylation domain-containing protein [Lachnospiraceae bacterium]|nr:prepilin-type N-terminal cleavage/methylation domain-containing protein [Lachnospiraceae bacterium]
MKIGKEQKLNNAGFSLLELMVAVLILAVISAPFLHSFVTTARVNRKAKNKLNATMAAQDIMEGLKGSRTEEIEAQFADPAGVSVNFTLIANEAVRDRDNIVYQPSDPDGFQYVIKNLKYQNATYDARIKLDAAPYRDKSKQNTSDTPDYVAPNFDPLIQVSAMDNSRDGIFMADNREFQDYVMEELKKQDAASDWGHVTRTFTIQIAKTGSVGDVDTQLVKVDTEYKDTVTGAFYKESNTAYSNEVTASSGCTLRGMYFFYFPCYSAKQDVIDIYNPDKIECTVYLMKQKTTVPSELAMLQSLELSYRPKINLFESGATIDNKKTTIRSNFTKNLYFSEDPEQYNDPANQLNRAEFGFNYSYGWPARYYGAEDVANTEQVDRMFEAVVEIYEGGTADSPSGWEAEKRLAVLEGSKIDQ